MGWKGLQFWTIQIPSLSSCIARTEEVCNVYTIMQSDCDSMYCSQLISPVVAMVMLACSWTSIALLVILLILSQLTLPVAGLFSVEELNAQANTVDTWLSRQARSLEFREINGNEDGLLKQWFALQSPSSSKALAYLPCQFERHKTTRLVWCVP